MWMPCQNIVSGSVPYAKRTPFLLLSPSAVSVVIGSDVDIKANARNGSAKNVGLRVPTAQNVA